MNLKIKSIQNLRTKLVILSLVTISTLFNLSCQKYVDIDRGNTRNIVQTANDCQLLLDNYTVINTGYPSDGEASSDDYYLTNAGYLLSALAPTDRDLYIWSTTAIRPGAQPQWESSYQVVFQANLMLETINKIKSGNTDPAATPTLLNTLTGSALFLRSFAFWQVAQLYAKPYLAATSGQDPGIPIRLSSDINVQSQRGTVSGTYNQIIQDLKQAISLLPATSIVATRPNQASAYALLARVYLSMEDYPDALTNADAALKISNQLINFNTLNANSNTPFSPRFNKEVIFHAIMAPDPGINPGSAFSNVAKIDSNLYASYQANDLRQKIFFKQNSGTDIGTHRFTGNYEPVTSATFFDGLAVDELYLIRAECYARASNTISAMNDLNTLLTTRWKTGTYVNMTAASADQALALILAERRKELLMRGVRWSDLRRLNRDTRFAKTLTRTIQGTVYTLPPNDPRYTLLIPQEVILNSPITQNTH
ncbi:RagB/SusD family nutrient uptake outer membrane protein [Pedobacter cryoconitis]|uniref:Tetratricopeptide (TPR) repeat protein n=1 Tax=Pedobacter cryoconitis TaxID=188932 RepID=A0A7X0J5T5_9SPHI|nr:RagB/SusD family nutrient uptake outer membrane protein [Pedobacter cryoconitis]MBB6501659.1 tetratricopeptide (TPR) repeat protein [Pedobacter cryoconitis]